MFITEDEEIGYEIQAKRMKTRLTSRIIHDRHSKGLVLNGLLIESCFHCREQNSLMRRMENKERRDRFGKWYLVWLETGGRHNAVIPVCGGGSFCLLPPLFTLRVSFVCHITQELLL